MFKRRLKNKFLRFLKENPNMDGNKTEPDNLFETFFKQKKSIGKGNLQSIFVTDFDTEVLSIFLKV